MVFLPCGAVRNGHMKLVTYKQLEVIKLIPGLRIPILPRHRNLKKNIDGAEGRLNKIRKTLTDLVKEERIELHFARAHEVQGYAERLIAEAVRYGDKHKPTMEVANFYLHEKQLIHKLFKVLVPRYINHQGSYTSMYNAPLNYPKFTRDISVLELKGNPYPRLTPKKINTRNWINNILLEELRKETKS